MKFSRMNVLMALLGLGLAARGASAATVLSLDASNPLSPPIISYSGGLVSPIAGAFNLTGLNGVVIPAADLTGVTISLTGFSATGPVDTLSDPGVALQNLTSGTFTIFNSSSVAILTGSSSGGASLQVGTSAPSAGGVFNLGAVSYTGPLQGAFAAAGYTSPGTFSFSLSDISLSSPPVVGTVLSPFSATVSGLIAEPTGGGQLPGAPLPAAALSGLSMMGALGGIGAVVRRRRR